MHNTALGPAIGQDRWTVSFSKSSWRVCGCIYNALTGEQYWTHDMFAAAWSSPCLVDGKVYIGDEDGDVTIFKHGPELEIISEVNMGNSVYSTPVVANGVMYISNKSTLFAIGQKK